MTTQASPIECAVRQHGVSFLDGFTTAELEALAYDWQMWARPNQLAPEGDWLTWLILTGRGWGKTRTGAEWIRQRVEGGAQRIAIVGRTPSDTRDVMVEGESGLLAVFPDAQKPTYEPSKRRVTFHTGAIATTFSSENPDQLRGPQHDTAWCDELASFKTREAWDNLQLGLRLGNPQQVITTTPRPTSTIRELVKDENTVVTRGTTYENKANLAGAFLQEVIRRYEGTRLGQQELQGLLLEDVPGALWQRSLIKYGKPPELRRIVVALDPSVSDGEQSAECGIVVAGERLDEDFATLEDASLRTSPLKWAECAVSLYHKWGADKIVYETNQGGDLIPTLIRLIDKNVALQGVHASVGKQARAEPIAALYEQGRVTHAEPFVELEDQLCSWIPGEGESPDRLDALVWALTALSRPPRRYNYSIGRV